jgi:hypothetical protein
METHRLDDLTRARVEEKYVLLGGEVDDLRSRLEGPLGHPAFRKEEGWIATVYLDRPDGALGRAALSSPWENLKLRLRAYFTPQGTGLSPLVWIEIKERRGPETRKCRFQIHRRWLVPFLEGGLDLGEILSCGTRPGDPGTLVEAAGRLREVASGPLVAMGAVRYRRLALEGGSPRARLTIDQEVRYHLGPDTELRLEAPGPAALEEEGAVVEVKYQGARPPAWCERGVEPFSPVAYSKFAVLSALAISEAVAAHADQLRRD